MNGNKVLGRKTKWGIIEGDLGFFSTTKQQQFCQLFLSYTRLPSSGRVQLKQQNSFPSFSNLGFDYDFLTFFFFSWKHWTLWVCQLERSSDSVSLIVWSQDFISFLSIALEHPVPLLLHLYHPVRLFYFLLIYFFKLNSGVDGLILWPLNTI